MRSHIIYIGIISGCVWGSASLQGSASHFKGDNHWDLYGDFLYMKRSDLHGVSLVKNKEATVIRSKDLIRQFDFEPGYRVGLLYSSNAKYGCEGVFSYLEPWKGSRDKHRDDSLSFPFKSSTYDADFTDASRAKAQYSSHFWDAQLNFWRYFTPRLENYFGLSALMGLRFFNWDEFFKLQMVKSPDTSSYKIKTENRILGAQLGVDFQMHPARWLTWELLAKGGVFANNTEQSQFLGAFNNLVSLRNSTTQKWQAGFFGDVSAQMRIECRRWLNIHVGYEALFLTGLSLAPEQVSKKVGHDAGKKDRTRGNGIIQGLFAGLTVRF